MLPANQDLVMETPETARSECANISAVFSSCEQEKQERVPYLAVYARSKIVAKARRCSRSRADGVDSLLSRHERDLERVVDCLQPDKCEISTSLLLHRIR